MMFGDLVGLEFVVVKLLEESTTRWEFPYLIEFGYRFFSRKGDALAK